jgi:transposase
MGDGVALQQWVRGVIAQVRAGTFEYESRPPPVRDWSAYDAAKTGELPDVLRLIRGFVELAEQNLRPPEVPVGPRGRPRTAAADLAKALLAQSYVGKANRIAQGLCEAVGPRLGLSCSFSYKTIERGYDDDRVIRILWEVLRLTNVPVQGLERVFSVDGSCMVTSVRDNYAAAREHQRGRSSGAWPDSSSARVYNVAIIGVEYKLFAAWKAATDPHARELAHFPAAFEQAQTNQPGMGMLLGDGLYAGRPQVGLVARAGVIPRFLPPRNATLKRLGCGAWIEMLLTMAREPQRWLSEYHGRSISECGFSVTNVGPPMRKRLAARKETESLLRALVYNIRRLAQLRYLVGLMPLDPATAC